MTYHNLTMAKLRSKAELKKAKPEFIDGELMKEYQEPEIFKMKFQQSENCRLFRKAWGIPAKGFESFERRFQFHEDLRKKDYEYSKLDRCKSRWSEVTKKRMAWARGKIKKSELELAEFNFALTIPTVKYDFDLDGVVIIEKKPTYWRSFIETCLLLQNPMPQFIQRPLPKPKLQRSNELQRYELTIENIFADTTIRDFSAPEFIRMLKKYRKTLPGYGPTKRSKSSFKAGQMILELDENGSLYDWEKADKIEGLEDIPSTSPREDQRRKNRVKQIRHRTKRRLGLI